MRFLEYEFLRPTAVTAAQTYIEERKACGTLPDIGNTGPKKISCNLIIQPFKIK
jgi:hypothetical protein